MPRSSTGSSAPTFEYMTGDLFEAPNHAVLVHSCNCEGVWGAGIATAMKSRYPDAFEEYHGYTQEQPAASILGQALLSAPQHPDQDNSRSHRVASLLVKELRGKPRSRRAAAAVVADTTSAMTMLFEQLAALESSGEIVGDVCMPKINAGIFRIPWNQTEAGISSIRVTRPNGEPFRIYVYTRG